MLKHYSQALGPAHSPTRSWLSILAAAALAFTLFFGPIYAAAAAEPSPQRKQLTLSTEIKPWTGDLDGMIERRIIRVLTVYSKTFYFVDKGIQRGSTYELFQLFEKDLNKKLTRDNKLKQKHLKVRVVFVPIARGDLLQALADGKGDIAASNLTVTEERRKLVDFSSPVYRNASEVLVSGPASPAISSVDELAGKEVFVRRSSQLL
jgi:ABC-type amino acid transport substrate-binding protein